MKKLTNSVVMDFLRHTHARFMASTPAYHKTIQTLLFVCMVITGLPETLQSLGLVLPPELQAVSSKSVAIASAVGMFIAQLSVNDPSTLKK